MSKGKVIGICAGVGTLLIFGTLLIMFVSYYNYGNSTERQIEAVWENNQNVLSSYTNRVMEMAQVNEMYRDDVREVIEAALSARYGDEGMRSTWSWVQEQNPSLDASVYTRLQQTIESGRQEFRVAQTRLIDVKRNYNTALGALPGKFFLSFAGYPTIDLDSFNVIISQEAQDAFESGVDAPVRLRRE
jgi:hypothetical protein